MKLKLLVKKYTPSADTVSKRGLFRHIGRFLLGQNIWHLNRRSVSYGAFIGIFCAMLPIPGQMLVAAFMALIFRAHLPLSLASTWISNPLTYAPIYYFNYRVGLWLFDDISEYHALDFDLIGIYDNLNSIMKPLFAGSFLIALISAIFGFILVRLYWRITVVSHWGKRKQRVKDRFVGQAEQNLPSTEIEKLDNK